MAYRNFFAGSNAYQTASESAAVKDKKGAHINGAAPFWVDIVEGNHFWARVHRVMIPP
jgi:hypothetical protein